MGLGTDRAHRYCGIFTKQVPHLNVVNDGAAVTGPVAVWYFIFIQRRIAEEKNNRHVVEPRLLRASLKLGLGQPCPSEISH